MQVRTERDFERLAVQEPENGEVRAIMPVTTLLQRHCSQKLSFGRKGFAAFSFAAEIFFRLQQGKCCSSLAKGFCDEVPVESRKGKYSV